MQIKKSVWITQIFLIAVIMTVINMGLSSFFMMKLNKEITGQVLFDVFTIILTVGLGFYLATKVNFPLWWKRDCEKSLAKQLIILILLGLAVIIPNTVIYYFNQNTVAAIPWTNFTNLKEPILLAMRAGLQEEIIFRLFLFTLITYAATKIVHSTRKSIVIGIAISSLLFGMMHGFYPNFAYISGGILAYIFYKNGLIPAMIIHFLADVIPWILLIVWRS